MRQFRDLYLEAATECGDTTSRFLEKARNIAFNAMEAIYNDREWWFSFKTDRIMIPKYSFQIGLPERIQDVRLVFLRTVEDPLDESTEADIEIMDRGKDQEGSPRRYCLSGHGVLRQLSSKLTIVSTSAADTTQELTITGMFRGRMVEDTLSLNGTTDVESTYDFDDIEKAELDDECAGTVTCKSNNSQAVTNFTLTAGVTDTDDVSITQPASKLVVTSTSSSDDTAFSAYFTGIHPTYPDVRYKETLALNGTAAVTSVNRFQKVDPILVTDSSGTQVTGTRVVTDEECITVAEIESGNKALVNRIIAIHPDVAENTPIYISYRLRMMRKYNDNYNLFPFPSHFFSVLKAQAKAEMYFDLGFPGKSSALYQKVARQLLPPLRVEDFNKQRDRSTINYNKRGAELGYPGPVSV